MIAISEIVSRVDLATLIGGYIVVKKIGKTPKACCPFHEEKTPSFVIYDQNYHCFGCGAHGDALDFIEQYENKDRKQAIDALKQVAGIVETETWTAPPKPQYPRIHPDRLIMLKTITCMIWDGIREDTLYANIALGSSARGGVITQGLIKDKTSTAHATSTYRRGQDPHSIGYYRVSAGKR
jgi:hypothetical protein